MGAHSAKKFETADRSGIVIATVQGLADDGRLRVTGATIGTVVASVAAGLDCVAEEGDQVVVAMSTSGESFVIGTLRAAGGSKPLAVATRTGASAAIAATEAGEILEVRDPAGALLFEYRADEGRSVVHAPVGNLEFRADQGEIGFVARDGVRIGVESAPVSDGERMASGELHVGPMGVRMRGPEVRVDAIRTHVKVDEARVVARSVAMVADRARHVVGVLEVQADRVVERARNTYREVTGLAQTRAGQVKLIAEDAIHMLSERTLIRARDDIKIKAEKIHLA